MKKSRVINLPIRHAATGEDGAYWFIAISPFLDENYSCEYNAEKDYWSIIVKANTFQAAEVLVEKCRHILGWDTSAGRKEADAK